MLMAAKAAVVDSMTKIGAVPSGLFIPPQPRLLQEIAAAGDDLDRIADLIAADPGMAAAVLKTVNSPVYGFRRNVVAIRQAVLLLGLKSASQIVNGLQLRMAMQALPAGGIKLDEFWDTAQDVANIAAVVARQLNVGLVDEAYALGLFHNAGVAILALSQPGYLDAVRRSYADPHANLTAIEFASVQTNHAAVGYRVARVWKLPPLLCDAIRLHHAFARSFIEADHDADNEQLAMLLCVLKIAEHFARLHQRLGGQAVDHEWEQIQDAVLNTIGLSAVDFVDLRDAVSNTLGALP